MKDPTELPAGSNGAEMGAKPQPRVLGDFFSFSDFPEDQQTRIAESAAAADSPCGQVIRSYAPRTELYKGPFMKREHIAGARPGHHLYRAQSIQRIISYLADPNHGRHRLAWDIYEAAAKLYVEKELPSLNRLLKETPVSHADMTVADALRTTCSRASEYDVSTEQILRFYDVWGVARVEDFETLLTEWMKPDEAAQQRRQIADLRADIVAITSSVSEARAETSSLRQLATGALKAVADGGDAQRELVRGIASLTDKADLGDRRLKELEEGAKRLSNRVDDIQRDIGVALTLKAEMQRLETGSKAAIEAATTVSHDSLASALRGELAAVKSGLESQIAEVSSKLSGFIEGMARGGASSGATPRGEPRTVRLGAGLEWSLAKRALSTKAELLRGLATSFRSRGVDPSAAIRVHAAIAAGVMPVLVGSFATQALEAYGDVVFGGRVVKAHVTPGLVEMADLFGRVDPERGVYLPHHSRILDAAMATGSVGSAMVLLEGINRGPTESYLLPLLTNNGPIRLFHEAVVHSSDVPSAVEWPRGLRLAATCVVGPTSLPLSPDLWTHAVVIEVAPAEDTANVGSRQLSEFRLDDSAIAEAAVAPELLSSLLHICPEALNSRAVMDRFARSFAALNGSESELRSALVETSLLPVIATLESEEERRVRMDAVVQEVGQERANGLQALERRLRRSLA